MRVDFDEQKQTWVLEWNAAQLHLHLADSLLVNDYFGPAQRSSAAPYSSPYRDPLFDTRTEAFIELAPGSRPVAWELQNWTQPDENTFEIRLHGKNHPLTAALAFAADPHTGLMRRKTLLTHSGNGKALDIGSAVSFAATLPAEVQDVVYLTGAWSMETLTRRERIGNTPFLLESRAGKTGYEFAPYLAVTAPEYTCVFEIAWSGNWQMHLRRHASGQVIVSGGLNDWGLRHTLRPGEALHLPDALLLCVPGDLNHATQQLHDYRRASRPQHRVPVHFNTWYRYFDKFTLDDLKQAADEAAALDCEAFVVDAGWFTGESGSGHWYDTVGDWAVNRERFPSGIEELAEYVRAKGLDFGIWFEPESVSVGSWIHRHHPEWLHTLDGATLPPYTPNRAIINLGIPAAREWIREKILSILRLTSAAWMKWDFNINLLQGGWTSGLPDDLTHRDPLIAHVNGVYQLQDEIRAAMPSDFTLEMCAGGGGRFDPAIMSHAHVTWLSDEVRALRHLAMRFGSHLAHPAVECNGWLVDWPPHYGAPDSIDTRGDLAFRTRAAMLGSFGISAPVSRWNGTEIALVRDHVRLYRDFIRPLIESGNQYLLTDAPPFDGNGDWAAVWHAAKDGSRGVLFAFRLAGSGSQRVFALPGLEAGARYRVHTFEGWESTYTGAELTAGLNVSAPDTFTSALVTVERVV